MYIDIVFSSLTLCLHSLNLWFSYSLYINVMMSLILPPLCEFYFTAVLQREQKTQRKLTADSMYFECQHLQTKINFKLNSSPTSDLRR